MQFSAPAKLNLYLHVTGRREDGYHELESLVTFCDLADVVTISSGAGLSFTCDGPFAAHIDLEYNLCVRAARMLAEHMGRSSNLHIHLQKNIPVAAGLGGGSADAAAVLQGLLQFWGVSMEDAALSALGLSLGADVPVCLQGRSCVMRGVGEQITPCACPALHAVLVNPNKSCSTKEIFQSFDFKSKGLVVLDYNLSCVRDVIEFIDKTENHLTDAAQEKIPDIAAILDVLMQQEECALARMTGSGATCFGVFHDQNAADVAARNIRAEHPEWWVYAARTLA